MIAGHNDLLDEITWHAKFDCPRAHQRHADPLPVIIGRSGTEKGNHKINY